MKQDRHNNWSFLKFLFAVVALTAVGCDESSSGSAATASRVSPSAAASQSRTIGVAFETLQTEYWVAGFEAIKAELSKRQIKVLEAIADGDANRQLEQVKNLVTRKVDGIIMVPKDAKTAVPAIKAANDAGIPVVLFNRSADPGPAQFVSVQADNLKLAQETVAFMVGEARKTGRKHKAMVVLGDLGDLNAIGRRDGFDAAVKGNEATIEVVARVPSEWNQEKAQAGVVNALQAHPDISFLFTSSDFLFPSIVAALKQAGKYHKIGAPGHVILGGFDGDAMAWQMMVDGYLDATGVQDVYFEASASVQAVLDLLEKKPVPALIRDPGFVITQENKEQMKSRMWGAKIKD